VRLISQFKIIFLHKS